MKKILILLIINLVSITFGQESINLNSSGSGKTKEDAKNNALRNALELTYGTFISSNTQILNDEIIKDEIVSVTSGNIQDFKIINESQLPDGSYFNLLNVTISVNKLKKFAENKGDKIEFQGSLFATDVKLEQINEKNEIAAIVNTLKAIEKILPNAFDFEFLETPNPKKREGNLKDNYSIHYVVKAKPNENFDLISDLLINTVSNLSNSNENKEKIILNNKDYYLRSSTSKKLIELLFENMISYYSGNFVINDGIKIVDNLNLDSSNMHPDKSPKLLRITEPRIAYVDETKIINNRIINEYLKNSYSNNISRFNHDYYNFFMNSNNAYPFKPIEYFIKESFRRVYVRNFEVSFKEFKKNTYFLYMFFSYYTLDEISRIKEIKINKSKK